VSERAGLVIVAAGAGTRLRAGRPKALVPLGGRPLLLHAVERLATVAWLDPLVVVIAPGERRAFAAALEGVARPLQLVDGGARRQDSVLAGLRALPPDCGLVLVHDAARPFVPLAPLPGLAASARRLGAALLAVPVADTIKRTQPGDPALCAGTLPRDTLRAAQTPQAFRRAELAGLLERAAATGTEVTDEAALFEAAGLAVGLVEGSARNFKVTTPADLELAEALLAALPPGGT
jgi:2-C-methyl-D-erythritol 4-phosphate cytidylyltransferase